VSQQVEAAKADLAKQAEEKARSAVGVELEDLRRQADEKEKLLKAAQAAELELRQQKRVLEEREKTQELEVARKLDDERRKIEEATAKRLDEEHRLREAEKDKMLQDALKVNEDLRRKLQQGSQQAQGEVLELELETLLTNAFPWDSISPVPQRRHRCRPHPEGRLAVGSRLRHHHLGSQAHESMERRLDAKAEG
jgi:hypothetical protein